VALNEASNFVASSYDFLRSMRSIWCIIFEFSCYDCFFLSKNFSLTDGCFMETRFVLMSGKILVLIGEDLSQWVTLVVQDWSFNTYLLPSIRSSI